MLSFLPQTKTSCSRAFRSNPIAFPSKANPLNAFSTQQGNERIACRKWSTASQIRGLRQPKIGALQSSNIAHEPMHPRSPHQGRNMPLLISTQVTLIQVHSRLPLSDPRKSLAWTAANRAQPPRENNPWPTAIPLHRTSTAHNHKFLHGLHSNQQKADQPPENFQLALA